jgi:hypothetical protein
VVPTDAQEDAHEIMLQDLVEQHLRFFDNEDAPGLLNLDERIEKTL